VLRIVFEKATKVYEGRTVLDGVTCEFASGVTAIMGHNGSGKSTLLRLATLLEEPDAGRVRCFDASTGAELEHGLHTRRRISLVLPRGGLFNSSALDNAAYGLRVRGIGRAEARERGMAELERVGLVPRADQNALTLSSGESQRLAIARALAVGPEVLMLDEPTASVDEEACAIMEEIILGLKSGPGGLCIVMTTHDPDEAVRLADRTLRLSQGQLTF